MVNAEKINFEINNGYAVIYREWITGDEIKLTLPLEVRTVKSNEKLKETHGKIAIDRGPIVYCIEGKAKPDIQNIIVSGETEFMSTFNTELPGGFEVIRAKGKKKNETFTAISYSVLNNRRSSKMEVRLNEN